MYKILIEGKITPHLSAAKRGFKTKSCLSEIVNSILYKLKTGIQWHIPLVESLFSDTVLSLKQYSAIFVNGTKMVIGMRAGFKILSKNKVSLDLSSVNIDGSHIPALKGDEQVAYQEGKGKL